MHLESSQMFFCCLVIQIDCFKQAYGFPLNLPRMEKEVILQRVKATGIHQLIGVNSPNSAPHFQSKTSGASWISRQEVARLTRTPQADEVQFTVAVYAKAYPGGVVSIWIYLVALWLKLGHPRI